MFGKEETYCLVITVLAAVLIAASNVGPMSGAEIPLAYLYWLVRLAIEAGLFLGIRELIERRAPTAVPAYMTTGLAIALSLPAFALSITAFDIILGFPELGLEAGSAAQNSRVWEFTIEVFYLFDNHVALCLLLALPRLMARQFATPDSTEQTAPPLSTGEYAAAPASNFSPSSFLRTLDPPLNGSILALEAQEHYVRISTSEGSRMVLYRFSDLIRDLSHVPGLRVHRSHWVALAAVKETFKDGANMRIRLYNGQAVPVNRSYRNAVASALNSGDSPAPATMLPSQ
ncbi:MAG: LytTR family DNA-binding domain-containing protein [Stappiaceae bacterium]